MINAEQRPARRFGCEIIAAVLDICAQLEIGNHTWKAVPVIGEPVLIFDKNPNGMGTYYNQIGVRIELVHNPVAPRNFFQKIVEKIEEALKPAVVIPPLYEGVKVRCLTAEICVGDRRLASFNDSRRLRLFFKKDLEQIQSLLNKEVPEIINLHA